jgi:FOG: HEAT repeat
MRLKKQGPRWISKSLPDWPEPAETRLAAVNFFAEGDFRGDSFPSEAIPILFQIATKDQNLRIRCAAIAAIGNLARSSEGAMPLLCSLAEGDPDPTIRSSAIQAMSRLDNPSSRAIPVMLKALNSNQLVDRECAAKWFGRTGLVPEKAVPELVHRLEDFGMKSEAAAALTKYGPRAQFAVPKLIQLANASDRDVSSVAVWALLAIDRDAAAKAGIKSLDFQSHHMTQP